MNTRIKEIRELANMTQEEFGKKIGAARNTIANYETGNRNPSNAVITSICREFNINEEWLRTGEGEMQKPVDTDYEIISTLIGENDPKAKQAIIDYWKLSEQDKELFWNFINKFLIRKPNDSLAKSNDFQLIPDNPDEFEKKFGVDANNENIS